MAADATPRGAPRVDVDCTAIRENARAVCSRVDGRVVGVVKAVTAHPAVARAMLAGGVDGLADSRLRNLARLAEAGVDAERTALVPAMPSRVERVVEVADRSLQTDPAVVESLAAAARAADTTHEVILMVDTGDRREGVVPDDVVSTLRAMDGHAGVDVVGLGTNVGCLGGVVPTADAMREFVELVETAESALGRRLDVVSGGSTVTLPLAEAGTLPDRVTELRVGEAILLGTDVTRNREVPYLRQDAFTLHAEVVECIRKPSTPSGPQGNAVDGDPPEFEDRGTRERAVLALGTQDTVPDELTPLAAGVDVVGASSDHLVCDVGDAERDVDVGDTLAFRPGYGALVRAFTSAYVGVGVEGTESEAGTGTRTGTDPETGSDG